MCTIINRVYGLKTEAESTNERYRVNIFYEIIVEGAF